MFKEVDVSTLPISFFSADSPGDVSVIPRDGGDRKSASPHQARSSPLSPGGLQVSAVPVRRPSQRVQDDGAVTWRWEHVSAVRG